jgi:hypothetical protein
VYNRRQARWAEKLSRFNFVIEFRPGREAGKPDALSRRPDYWPPKGGVESTKRNEFTFLKPHQVQGFDKDQDCEVVYYSLCTAVTENLDIDEDLRQRIVESLPDDKEIGPYLEQLKDPMLPREDDVKEFLEPYSILEDLVLRNSLVYIPDSDEVKLQIIKAHHDTSTAGHLGQDKTLELLTRNYYWPRLRQFVNEYVRTCDTCARNKTPRRQPHGQLHPLPIPTGPWMSVSMDYIVELPRSNGYNTILLCVDRLTKMAHFCPTTTNVTAEESAKLYIKHVFKYHGLPNDIITDRGPQFTSAFTTKLLKLCDIHGNKSTAFHPQSDGQTERVNQTLEQYLRIFCDYQQDNWHELLPLAEFTYNNAKHSSTQLSPFFANYGYHPRAILRVRTPTNDYPQNPTAENLVQRYSTIHQQVKEQLKEAQSQYKEYYDRHVNEAPTFQRGDQVWLSRQNIRTTRPSAKLDFKRLGPYRVLEVVGESKLAYRLDLPQHMRIHPVFHVSKLTPYNRNTFPGRNQPPPPPIEVEDQLEWEVSEVLDSRIRRNKLEYLVDWVGYGPDSRTWEPVDNLANSRDTVEAYHVRYPNRPAPNDLPRTRRNAPAPAQQTATQPSTILLPQHPTPTPRLPPRRSTRIRDGRGED